MFTSTFLSLFITAEHGDDKMSQVLRLWYPFASTFSVQHFEGFISMSDVWNTIPYKIYNAKFHITYLFWYDTCSLIRKFKHDAKICRINDAMIVITWSGFPPNPMTQVPAHDSHLNLVACLWRLRKYFNNFSYLENNRVLYC